MEASGGSTSPSVSTLMLKHLASALLAASLLIAPSSMAAATADGGSAPETDGGVDGGAAPEPDGGVFDEGDETADGGEEELELVSCDEVGLVQPWLGRCYEEIMTCQGLARRQEAECRLEVVNRNASKMDDKVTKRKVLLANDEALERCRSPEFIAACKDLRRRKTGVCYGAARTPSLHAPDPTAAGKLTYKTRRKYDEFETMIESIDRFEAEYYHCMTAPPDKRACLFSVKDAAVCRDADWKLKKAWSRYVDDFERRALKLMEEEIDRLRRLDGPTTKEQNWAVESRLWEAEQLRRINEAVEWLQVDTDRLMKLEKSARLKMYSATGVFRAAVEDNGCPETEHSDPELEPQLAELLAEHLKATKTKGSALRERVKRLSLRGKPKATRLPIEGITHEDLQAFACVEQTLGGRRDCRVFRVAFRRSRTGEGEWGPWGFYTLGGGELMSCKKLRTAAR